MTFKKAEPKIFISPPLNNFSEKDLNDDYTLINHQPGIYHMRTDDFYKRHNIPFDKRYGYCTAAEAKWITEKRSRPLPQPVKPFSEVD